MNIAKIMIPKSLTVFLNENDTLRQGFELMTEKKYTALPVLNDHGEYVGSINEGDFLRYIMRNGEDLKEWESHSIGEILRRDFCPALSIDAEKESVIDSVLQQNFVPVVDGRNLLCGIITRRRLIAHLAGRSVSL